LSVLRSHVASRVRRSIGASSPCTTLPALIVSALLRRDNIRVTAISPVVLWRSWRTQGLKMAATMMKATITSATETITT